MTSHHWLAPTALAVTVLLSSSPAATAEPVKVGRPLLIQDADIAKPGPPPHEGKGDSVGFPISVTAGVPHLYFSKRIMRPGSTVGRHLMDVDEVYYLLSGEAELIDDSGSRPIKAGTAMFMTAGQTIEFRQRGKIDAVIIVASARP